MKTFKAACLLLLISGSFCCGNQQFRSESEAISSYSVSLKIWAENLEAPVGMAVANDSSNRLFIIEQQGSIRLIKNGQMLPKPFLDLRQQTDYGNIFYSEMGLLGMAFHPAFKSNGKFYVYYSASSENKDNHHKSVISEYTVSSSDPDRANPNGRKIMEIKQPESNHNGGQLAFGPDGFLYIGTGDGGGGGDAHGETGNGQNLKTLLGKILRIDVNSVSGYLIPKDNPFVNADAQSEIYAYGLRNPWRFSFDLSSGKLFCGDVGQNEWEEVNLIKKGGNYGWRIMEGNHCYYPPLNCNTDGLILPITEYEHTEGNCVIGGYVYRGFVSKAWQGHYLFGDWTGKVFVLIPNDSGTVWNRKVVALKNAAKDFYINSFGQDERGELYILGQNSIGPTKAGKLYRVVLE
jgi:glucose/arabinose dehydrogenase